MSGCADCPNAERVALAIVRIAAVDDFIRAYDAWAAAPRDGSAASHALDDLIEAREALEAFVPFTASFET